MSVIVAFTFAIALWYFHYHKVTYAVKPFATIQKSLPRPCRHWLTGGTFHSATGGTFQSDTDGTFHSDMPGTFESDMDGTFKVMQSSWSYIDVYLNEDSNVICVRLNASFESIDRAKAHFTMMKSTLEQTYGKGNEADETVTFWTDDTNSVRISYEESNAINGNDRSFCYMDYINIELFNEYGQSNVPDV